MDFRVVGYPRKGMFRPIPALRKGLSGGAISLGSDGITSSIAKDIVGEAEPVIRDVVREERVRLADALMSGIPFAALSVVAFAGTGYLMPDAPGAKFAGYTASAALLGAGAWSVHSRLSETVPSAEAAKASSALDPIAQRAAQAFAAESEPWIKAIMDEERTRAADALKTAVPFAAGSLATLLATLFVVSGSEPGLKVAGYSVSAILAGIGAWMALDKEAS